MATKQFALELGPHQIRVNSVNPTFVKTAMTMAYLNDPVNAERMAAIHPIGRIAEMHEAVNPILYLLSDSSSMVTGTTHLVDGGLLSHISV